MAKNRLKENGQSNGFGKNGNGSRLKEDKSPRIVQKNGLEYNLTITPNPNLTVKQQQIIDAILDNDVRIVILNGKTGTAKSYTAVLALLQLLNLKKIKSMIYIRSLIQSKDGETGYLPGTLEERCYYYNIPLMDQLEQILPKSEVNKLMNDERIVTYPTSMLRGYNFHLCGAILDECQNTNFDSLFTVASRLGFKSKLFLLGDTTGQNDLGLKTGFKKFCDIFSDEDSHKNGVRYFKLETCDILRSDFVRFLVEKIEAFDSK